LKKIVTIIGARPQFVKASVVSRALLEGHQIEEIIVHTGQHYDQNMSAVFFQEMEIPEPRYNLEVNGAGHGAMTGRMLEKIEKVLLEEKPDLVMVYGDTNSTLAGALAARKLNIPLAHVEAGLRSFKMTMPEEINRILTDRISDLLFCPTEKAVSNLDEEGFRHFGCRIYQVGDVMYDSALYYANQAEKKSEVINRLNLANKPFILCTIHRQENTDDIENLKSIIHALNLLSHDIAVVLPLHPRTRKIMQQHAIVTEFETIDPVGYFDIISLLKNCRLVITDSGGMQKEAYFFSKHCITLREETEWVELTEQGYNTLVGVNENKITDAFHKRVNEPFVNKHSLYGDGNASQKIARLIQKYLGA
jgi:UDP-GlcNAc3NAcA epimerase